MKKKIKNSQPQTKFAGSYIKKRVYTFFTEQLRPTAFIDTSITWTYQMQNKKYYE